MLHIAARNEQLDCLKEIVPKVSDDLKTATDKVWLLLEFKDTDPFNLRMDGMCCITLVLVAIFWVWST